MKSLCLIIPVYNGSQYLEETITLLQDAWSRDGNFFVVFVNDGSDDESADILDRFANTHREHVSVIQVKENRGKGAAICRAVTAYADKADIIGFTDVDLPYGLDGLDAVRRHVGAGAHLVIGDRSIGKKKQYSLYRQVGNRLFRFFLPSGVRDIQDTQSGFKFFRADIAGPLFSRLKTDRWVFDVELLLAAVRSGYTIITHPVELRREPKGRGGIHIFKNGPQIIRDMMRIRIYDRNNEYTIEE